jgi:iron(III) transport system permease protein
VGQALPRGVVILLTALAIFTPLALIFYQSFLSAPFFMPDALAGLDAYRFIFTDSDFWHAFEKSTALAFGLAVISVPLGGILAFLMVRSDLPGRRILEPLLMIPVFVSPMVLAFGYVVSAGPVGFYTVWFKSLFGGAPWNVYSFISIIIIAGLTHVPHVYLYVSSALRSLGSDVEEAARIAGASPLSVALNVSLPMVRPALLYAAVLVIFLGFEVFGLVLVLGDPEGHLVLATYLYKLTNKLGTPAYHLMAAVAVCLVDGGVGGEQQPRARRVTSITCTKQAKAEVGRSFGAVDEAHGLGLVAATERVAESVGRREVVARVHCSGAS